MDCAFNTSLLDCGCFFAITLIIIIIIINIIITIQNMLQT